MRMVGATSRCSKQVWNTGTLYDEDEQQKRGVVSCTYDAGQ